MDSRDELANDDGYLDLKRMLKALGDVVRLMMISVLDTSGEITVTDLAELLAARGRFVSQPLVSWHISQLRRAGFVRTRRVGRQVYCSLDTGRYRHCLHMLGGLAGGPDTTGRPHTPAMSPAISNAAERSEIQTR
ncbi:MAG TPA: metalloregulator ArsR/SmtB family transcription factor [Ktedonobacterales bacterium]